MPIIVSCGGLSRSAWWIRFSERELSQGSRQSFTQWVNTKLDKVTLVFSGWKGRADIFGGKAGSMDLFSPSEWEKIFDTLDRAK
jgi:hypothetical protein